MFTRIDRVVGILGGLATVSSVVASGLAGAPPAVVTLVFLVVGSTVAWAVSVEHRLGAAGGVGSTSPRIEDKRAQPERLAIVSPARWHRGSNVEKRRPGKVYTIPVTGTVHGPFRSVFLAVRYHGDTRVVSEKPVVQQDDGGFSAKATIPEYVPNEFRFLVIAYKSSVDVPYGKIVSKQESYSESEAVPVELVLAE